MFKQWGSYVTSVVGEIKQFGHEYLESVVVDEEEAVNPLQSVLDGLERSPPPKASLGSDVSAAAATAAPTVTVPAKKVIVAAAALGKKKGSAPCSPALCTRHLMQRGRRHREVPPPLDKMQPRAQQQNRNRMTQLPVREKDASSNQLPEPIVVHPSLTHRQCLAPCKKANYRAKPLQRCRGKSSHL